MLGAQVRFDGSSGLGPSKARKFLKDVRTRIRRTHRITRALPFPEAALLLCEVANRSLDMGSSLGSSASGLIRNSVSDRGQLKHFDSLISLEIAQALSGKRSVKSLRFVSTKTLRNVYRLKSLVALRNRRKKIFLK